MTAPVNVRRHTRRRSFRDERALARSRTLARAAAVPRWEPQRYDERTGRLRPEYRGRYKDVRLYVAPAANGTWYWSARKGGKDGFFQDSVLFIETGGPQSTSPGEAARRAEFAAGYAYAGEILEQDMGFQDPPETEGE